jgi:hypothetical protein
MAPAGVKQGESRLRGAGLPLLELTLELEHEPSVFPASSGSSVSSIRDVPNGFRFVALSSNI